MERFEPIERVRKQLQKKKEACLNSCDTLTNNRLDFIERMLNNERCFFEINRSVAIEILSFLEFSDAEIFELYDELIDFNLFKGNFDFIGIDETNKTIK